MYAPTLPALPQVHLYRHTHRCTCTPNNQLTLFSLASLLVYILGLRLLTSNFVMIFIITILLLAVDFYYLKNIAGRRLVGLRWWNEVDSATGDGRWVFESADPETRDVNPTDRRFFWIALYAQPVLWVLLAILALVSLEFIWLTLVGKSCLDRRGGCACVEQEADVQYSYRARFDGYKYPCLLEVRQVQPGEWLCVECHLRLRPGAQSGWGHDWRLVQAVMRICKAG